MFRVSQSLIFLCIGLGTLSLLPFTRADDEPPTGYRPSPENIRLWHNAKTKELPSTGYFGESPLPPDRLPNASFSHAYRARPTFTNLMNSHPFPFCGSFGCGGSLGSLGSLGICGSFGCGGSFGIYGFDPFWKPVDTRWFPETVKDIERGNSFRSFWPTESVYLPNNLPYQPDLGLPGASFKPSNQGNNLGQPLPPLPNKFTPFRS